jgi:hypothetical protein
LGSYFFIRDRYYMYIYILHVYIYYIYILNIYISPLNKAMTIL